MAAPLALVLIERRRRVRVLVFGQWALGLHPCAVARGHVEAVVLEDRPDVRLRDVEFILHCTYSERFDCLPFHPRE